MTWPLMLGPLGWQRRGRMATRAEWLQRLSACDGSIELERFTRNVLARNAFGRGVLARSWRVRHRAFRTSREVAGLAIVPRHSAVIQGPQRWCSSDRARRDEVPSRRASPKSPRDEPEDKCAGAYPGKRARPPPYRCVSPKHVTVAYLVQCARGFVECKRRTW